ncbi:MAG: NADH-quinone oxidoreductase subunit L [Bacteroidota bacterium]
MYNYVGLIVLFPLIGFLINGIFGSRIRSEKFIGWIGSLTVGLSFLVGSAILIEMLGAPVDQRKHIVEIFSWINAGALSVSVAYQVDQLSILMTMIVTGVGFLIHVYSIGYMHDDRGYWRFFAYLNLFIVAMLNLVLADNFVLMFLGWEGVGLCSYLLIGFWYDKKFEKGTTGDAAKKAFIVNRIGDFGFLLGMFLLFTHFQTLSFDGVFARAESWKIGDTTMTWITLLLFLGATGKSAQIPLFVWLPDAMAGPTPVSALIHAATMVTAGVYMVARCSLLYALAPLTMTVVAIVGALTAIFAATIGLVQNDIKKVLAYSTISQLGYMFLALGVGAFTAGIFHLMTHAFFKALLFLGSGAVIHAMHEEQDIQKMGGLKELMPKTYWTFLIGAIAIAGIPPFSGFFSKDEILWRVFSHESYFLWTLGVFGAGLTAFYMFRLVSLTFNGEKRWEHDLHPHEAPSTMTVPLIILAFLSIVGGFIGVPAAVGGGNRIEHFLEPVFEGANIKLGLYAEGVQIIEYILMALSVGVALLGVAGARMVYLRRNDIAENITKQFHGIYTLLWRKYFVDEIYDAAVVTPVVKVSDKILWNGFDVGVIDGIVNGSAKLMQSLSSFARRIQTGVVQFYAIVFVIGVLLVMGWMLFR